MFGLAQGQFYTLEIQLWSFEGLNLQNKYKNLPKK